jgi:predicted peptidase
MRRLSAAVFLALSATVFADDHTGFLNEVHKTADGKEIPYVVFVPHSYKKGTPTPAILFLHGSGETKGGQKPPVEVGLPVAIKAREKTFPFITIIPQAQTRSWQAEGPNAKMALEMLETTMKAYTIDPKQVILSGLSMGGYGTWSLAAKYPDRWAAIVPVCGGGDPKSAEAIKHIPCWCFHGDKDTAVKVEKSREMIEAIKKAGGTPTYTEYPGVPHNSWDKAYGTDELYVWMLKQKAK